MEWWAFLKSQYATIHFQLICFYSYETSIKINILGVQFSGNEYIRNVQSSAYPFHHPEHKLHTP